MPKELPVLPSVKIVMRHAARCAQGALAGIDHASLPVPAPGADGTRWAVLLSPTRERPADGEGGGGDGANAANAASTTNGADAASTATAANAASTARRAREIGAPAYVLALRADLGEPVELAQVSPAEVGLAGAPDAWLGELPPPVEAAKRARLAELLDFVMPRFAAGRPGATEAERAAAAELRDLFAEVAEAPLVPCYRAVGKRFFAWLDRAAG